MHQEWSDSIKCLNLNFHWMLKSLTIYLDSSECPWDVGLNHDWGAQKWSRACVALEKQQGPHLWSQMVITKQICRIPRGWADLKYQNVRTSDVLILLIWHKKIWTIFIMRYTWRITSCIRIFIWTQISSFRQHFPTSLLYREWMSYQ